MFRWMRCSTLCLTLTFAYTVLVLPYAYRAIDTGLSAIDARTLAEAARSLGIRRQFLYAKLKEHGL